MKKNKNWIMLGMGAFTLSAMGAGQCGGSFNPQGTWDLWYTGVRFESLYDNASDNKSETVDFQTYMNDPNADPTLVDNWQILYDTRRNEIRFDESIVPLDSNRSYVFQQLSEPQALSTGCQFSSLERIKYAFPDSDNLEYEQTSGFVFEDIRGQAEPCSYVLNLYAEDIRFNGTIDGFLREHVFFSALNGPALSTLNTMTTTFLALGERINDRVTPGAASAPLTDGVKAFVVRKIDMTEKMNASIEYLRRRVAQARAAGSQQ